MKKKTTQAKKLNLHTETLRNQTLRPEELEAVAGGACTNIATCLCRKASFPPEACC